MTEDSETEEEEADPWMPVVEEAMQEHNTGFQEMKMNLIHSGLDEQTAGEKAYSNIPPELQNDSPMATTTQERSSAYENYAKDALMNDDDFDPKEVMEAAVNRRKFLIKRRLKDCSFTEDSDDDEDH